MDNQYYKRLIQEVIRHSCSDIWDNAVLEWEIVSSEEDDEAQSICVCGKENLRYLYTIQNVKNGNILFPIGSTCIKKFGRGDLDQEIAAYEDMFRLLRAVEAGEYIELTSKFFTRRLLLYLLNNDAFEANEYNHFNPEFDYEFLIQMFNKRNKDDITYAQQRKIRAIIVNSIIPFMKTKIK